MVVERFFEVLQGFTQRLADFVFASKMFFPTGSVLCAKCCCECGEGKREREHGLVRWFELQEA